MTKNKSFSIIVFLILIVVSACSGGGTQGNQLGGGEKGPMIEPPVDVNQTGDEAVAIGDQPDEDIDTVLPLGSPCANSNECGADEYCHQTRGCQAQCQATADCGSRETCQDGRCEAWAIDRFPGLRDYIERESHKTVASVSEELKEGIGNSVINRGSGCYNELDCKETENCVGANTRGVYLPGRCVADPLIGAVCDGNNGDDGFNPDTMRSCSTGYTCDYNERTRLGHCQKNLWRRSVGINARLNKHINDCSNANDLNAVTNAQAVCRIDAPGEEALCREYYKQEYDNYACPAGTVVNVPEGNECNSAFECSSNSEMRCAAGYCVTPEAVDDRTLLCDELKRKNPEFSNSVFCQPEAAPRPVAAVSARESACRDLRGATWQNDACVCQTDYVVFEDSTINADGDVTECVRRTKHILLELKVANESNAGTDARFRLELCPSNLEHNSLWESSDRCLMHIFNTNAEGAFERNTLNRVVLTLGEDAQLRYDDSFQLKITNLGGGNKPGVIFSSAKIYTDFYQGEMSHRTTIWAGLSQGARGGNFELKLNDRCHSADLDVGDSATYKIGDAVACVESVRMRGN